MTSIVWTKKNKKKHYHKYILYSSEESSEWHEGDKMMTIFILGWTIPSFIFSTPTAKNEAVCEVYIFSWLFLSSTYFSNLAESDRRLQTEDELECEAVWISEKLPFATFTFTFMTAMSPSCHITNSWGKIPSSQYHLQVLCLFKKTAITLTVTRSFLCS